MNSVKFGQRGGRYKAVEDEMIETLKQDGFVNVYPQTHRFCIEELIDDLKSEIRKELCFEEIEFSNLKFEPFSNSFVMRPELRGYKIFVK